MAQYPSRLIGWRRVAPPTPTHYPSSKLGPLLRPPTAYRVRPKPDSARTPPASERFSQLGKSFRVHGDITMNEHSARNGSVSSSTRAPSLESSDGLSRSLGTALAHPSSPCIPPHPNVEGDPRSLPPPFVRDRRLSYGDPNSPNLLIRGDNLNVLDLLKRSRFHGAFRCIYLDPPYNNQESYRHYRDDLGHNEWIELISRGLEQFAPFLSVDGSIWISIDDREVHYLKVAADKVFGRNNFVSTIVWQQRTTRENRKAFSNNHEYVLLYAAHAPTFRKSRNLLPPSAELLARYRNLDSDPRGPWQSISASVQDGHATASQHYSLTAPNGTVHRPPKGRCWVYSAEKMKYEIAAGNIWFGTDGYGVPRIKHFLHESRIGLTPETLWAARDVGTNDDAKKQQLSLLPRQALFDTPKPEPLICRILQIATDEGDLVLDPFLGSGTTAAVAHKMCRRYVGIERGGHAVTHCAGRLRLVVDGEQTGVSKALRWDGGGGFQFYRVRA